MLHPIKVILNRLQEDDSGQGVLEYIVILSACMVGAAALSRQMLKALDTGVMRLGAQLEQDLKTGRVSLGAWDN